MEAMLVVSVAEEMKIFMSLFMLVMCFFVVLLDLLNMRLVEIDEEAKSKKSKRITTTIFLREEMEKVGSKAMRVLENAYAMAVYSFFKKYKRIKEPAIKAAKIADDSNEEDDATV